MPVQISYSNIFNIKLTHAYFRGGVPRDFALVPSPETSKQFQSLGILMKQRDGEYKFFAKKGLEEHLKTIQDTRFVFHLSNDNPSFINFTDIPLEFNPFKNQNILFYHNAKRQKQLTQEKTSGTQDLLTFGADRLPILINQKPEKKLPGRIYIEKKESESFTLDIIDGLTDKVLWSEQFTRSANPAEEEVRVYFEGEQVLKRENIRKGSVAFELNLESIPEGKYKINVDGTEAMSFCLVRNTMRPPMGMVSIFVKDLLEQLDATKPEGPSYEIAFGTRNTHWKYFFFAESSSFVIEKVSIAKKATGLQGGTNGTDPKTFKLVPKIDEAAQKAFGEKVPILLVSNETIPLKEEQDYKFEFTVKAKKITDQSPLDFQGDLPAANPDRLRVIEEDGSSDVLLYSEVYVYL